MAANISSVRTPLNTSGPQVEHPSDPRSRLVDQERGRFQYENLVDDDEIRLLELLPGTDEKIRCSLQHYRLRSSDRPSYRALSYTWDNESARNDLVMPEQRTLEVRRNLWDALLSLRDSRERCFVWCDAVCIDQSSKTERNHQVRLMAEVYRNANIVVAWLDSAGAESSVPEAIHCLSSNAGTRRGKQSSAPSPLCSSVNIEQIPWNAMLRLCNVRYWSRKWIIQELLHARTVVLQSRDGQCFMTDLETFLHRLRSGKKKLEEQRILLSTPGARIALQRRSLRAKQPANLHALIQRYANNECEDPADHVYALWSLAGSHREHLAIDYRSSPVERCRDVLRFVIDHEGLSPKKLPQFACLLKDLLRVDDREMRRDTRVLDELFVKISVSSFEPKLLPECYQSQELRSIIPLLNPIQSYSMSQNQNTDARPQDTEWKVGRSGLQLPHQVGRADMVYFGLKDANLVGLASCRLEESDRLWSIPGTHLFLIVRPEPAHAARIIGTAYIFSSNATDKPRILASYQAWLSVPQDWGRSAHAEEKLHISCTDLFALIKLTSLEQVKLDKGLAAKESVADRRPSRVSLLSSLLHLHFLLVQYLGRSFTLRIIAGAIFKVSLCAVGTLSGLEVLHRWRMYLVKQ